MEKLYSYIGHCEDERCISDEMAMLLKGSKEVPVKVGGFVLRVDVVKDGDAYEVKLDSEPYEGVGQAMAFKAAGMRPHLVHVLKERAASFDDYVEFYEALKLDFCVHIIAVDGRYKRICPS